LFRRGRLGEEALTLRDEYEQRSYVTFRSPISEGHMMLRFVCLRFVLCGLGFGSRATAQVSSPDLMGAFDISESANAPGESPYVDLELAPSDR
jgi:hypothetical protein